MVKVGGGQLIDGEIRPGGGSREPSAVGEPLGQEPIELGPTLRGTVTAKVDISTVQGNDRLARGFVMPVSGSAKRRHGPNLQIR